MKHTMLDLNKMSLTQMTFDEMLTIDGGSFWTWLASAAVAVVGACVAVAGAMTLGMVIAVAAAGVGIWAEIAEW